MSADPKAPEPGRAPLLPLPDSHRCVVCGSELVEGTHVGKCGPAEPAAPMPRVSDAELARIVQHVASDPPSGRGSIIDALALDERDSRSRESALRAKVAGLEARIAALDSLVARRPALDSEPTLYDKVAKAIRVASEYEPGRIGTGVRERAEKAEKALARANEALREIAAYEPIGEPEAELATVHDAIVQIARDALAGAQGSAAQKMEGP